jgi:hypothetical protein
MIHSHIRVSNVLNRYINKSIGILKSYEDAFSYTVCTTPNNDSEDISYEAAHEHARLHREKWRAITSLLKDIKEILRVELTAGIDIQVSHGDFDRLETILADFRKCIPNYDNTCWDSQYLYAKNTLQQNFDTWIEVEPDIQELLMIQENFSELKRVS